MRKRKSVLIRMLGTLLLAVMMLATPLVSNATASVKFAYDDKDNPNNRTGIKSVVVDGKTYYDIYGGKSTRGTTDDELRFLQDMLTSKPDGAENSTIESWARLATNIYAANKDYASQRHAGGFQRDFIDKGSNNSDRAGYACLPERLAQTTSWDMGKYRYDYSCGTGLKLANSLSDVRKETAQSLIAPLKSKYTANEILNNIAGDKTLSNLKDDTRQDVLYNLVTCIDNSGISYKYTYNVFGLAFYDFKMHVLTTDGLEYITAAEGYEDLKQAAQSGVQGVKYRAASEDQNRVVNYYENGTKDEASISMEFTQSNSTTVSNSLENTSTYTYGETVGVQSALEGQIPFFVKGKTTLSAQFSSEQAFGTAYSEEKSLTKERSNTVGANLDLPGHTAAVIESSDGETSITLDYNCPVVLTYKVAIFSISGDIYEDKAATRSMSTARYSQGYFETVFGADTDKGGTTAQENLYNRAIKYGDTPSYDQVYGQTYGWKDMHDDGKPAKTINALNWKDVLNGTLITESDVAAPTVNITVECYEVNEKGEIQNDGKPFNSYIYGGKGVWEYTMPVTAVEKYPNLDKKKFDYTIFTELRDPGKEASEEDDTAEVPAQINAGLEKNSSGAWQKDITPCYDPKTGEKLTTVKFYYTKSETPEDSEDSSVSGQVTGAETVIPKEEGSALSGLKGNVTQLSTYLPMSASGGTMSYDSKSMSSKVKGIVPMYPLDKTQVTSGQKVFNMAVGDEINTENLKVDGYNAYNVHYYGFDQDKGHWVLVDQDGKEIKDGKIAALESDEATGNELLKATGEGTLYLQYKIDGNVYTSQNTTTPVKNEQLSSTAKVKVNVSKALFAGRVEADGTLVAYVGEPAINLDSNEDVEAYVFDETGKEIEGAVVTWQSEKAKSRGIVVENNTLSFTKPGEFKIRVLYNGGKDPVYSDWITVTAKPAKTLGKITIADDKDVLKSFILHDGSDEVNLSDLTLAAEDQYGNDWSKLDNQKWYVDGKEIKAEDTTGLKRYLYTATAAGEHSIYAECDGIQSNTLTLTVKEERKLDDLKITDTKDVLKSFILNDGDNKIKLSDLEVVAKDQYDADWKKLDGLTWYVNGVPADSEYTITAAGDYTIYAECGDVKSNELKLTVKEARKLADLTIADTKDVLKTFILNDGDNKIKLSDLEVAAKDQYDADWKKLDTLTWFVNGDSVDSTYTVSAAGDYTIHAECDGIKSNELTLTVKEPRKLASLAIEDEALSKDGLDVNETYDLSGVKVTALDQYGDPYEKAKDSYVWTTGGKYSKTEQKDDHWELSGIANGSDQLKLTAGEVEANSIDFKVVNKPVVNELFSSESSYIREGEAYDLKELKLTAKDQNGKPYELSDKEIASLRWELTEEGTIDTAKVTLDKDGRTILVEEGTLDYGKTGSVILTATLGENSATAKAVQVNVNVRQKPILDSLKLKEAEDAKQLNTGEKALLEDYFVIEGFDQYQEPFSLKDVSLTWASDDEKGFTIEGNQKLVAGKPDGTANITAATTNSIDKSVTSNPVKVSVVRVRTLQKIELTEVPKSIGFDQDFNMADLKAVCYDDHGDAYSAEDLAAYPASIFFTMDKGQTKAQLDTANNTLKSGDQEGYITVTAMAVNSSTNAISNTDGEDVVTKVRIWVGPMVEKISVVKEKLGTEGGSDVVSLTGENLVDGMTVALLDAEKKVVATGKTSGDDKKQTASIDVPPNDTKDAYVYTVRYAIHGEEFFEEPEAKITVARKIEYLKVGDTFTDGLYAYRVTNDRHDGKGTVTVIGFAKGKSAKNVRIPANAKANYDDNLTSYKVTAIGKRAFYKNSKILTINTGKNVKVVEREAFRNCKKVTKIVISDSVTEVKHKGFYDCFALKSLTIGKGITKLEAHSFCNASKLSKIVIRTSKLKIAEAPHVLIKVKNATVYAPAKKISVYKKMLAARGLKNAKFKKLK